MPDTDLGRLLMKKLLFLLVLLSIFVSCSKEEPIPSTQSSDIPSGGTPSVPSTKAWNDMNVIIGYQYFGSSQNESTKLWQNMYFVYVETDDMIKSRGCKLVGLLLRTSNDDKIYLSKASNGMKLNPNTQRVDGKTWYYLWAYAGDSGNKFETLIYTRTTSKPISTTFESKILLESKTGETFISSWTDKNTVKKQ